LAKLTLVLFLAVWMTRPTTDMRRFWKGLFPACVVLGILVGMVGAEDLGTAALLAAVGVALLIAGGARIMHLILLALPGVITFAAMIISKPYRVERLMSFTDIWATPRTTGYQAVQSLLTIISGGWQGKGVGMGVQKLGYLPEGDTDFIYAIICEELGFAGGALVIGLFLALLWCGRNALRHAADDLGRYIVLGVMLMMGMQAAMNIGVVTVSLPTTGIALPLVSAGGSGLLILGLSVGLVANVARSPSPADEEVEPARLRSRLGSRVAHAV
jgi:cell division protein FtsW